MGERRADASAAAVNRLVLVVARLEDLAARQEVLLARLEVHLEVLEARSATPQEPQSEAPAAGEAPASA